MNYQNKYLKYKNKYLKLKNLIGGHDIINAPIDDTQRCIDYLIKNYGNIYVHDLFNGLYPPGLRITPDMEPIKINYVLCRRLAKDSIYIFYPIYYYNPSDEDKTIKEKIKSIIAYYMDKLRERIKKYPGFQEDLDKCTEYYTNLDSDEFWQKEHFFVLGDLSFVGEQITGFHLPVVPRGDGHRFLCLIMKTFFVGREINVRQIDIGAMSAYEIMGFQHKDTILKLTYDRLNSICVKKDKFNLENNIKFMYINEDKPVEEETFKSLIF
jgi:hypothetical protein